MAFNEKVSVLQTATQAATNLVTSFVEAGFIENQSEALEQFFNLRDDVVKDLNAVAETTAASKPESKPKKPAYTGDPGEYKLTWGKHAGTAIKDLPEDYQEWILKNPHSARKEAEEQLKMFQDNKKAGV